MTTIFCGDCGKPIPQTQVECVDEDRHDAEHLRAHGLAAVWCEPPCVLPYGHALDCWDGEDNVGMGVDRGPNYPGTFPCRHVESLYGRCVACGMTWEQQAGTP